METKNNYLCVKTGKQFSSKQGFTNHLRHEYDSIESAFLFEKKSFTKKCIFCEKNAKFISFNKGYRDTCINKKCILKKKKITNIQLGKNRIENKNSNIEYYNYIISNISFYKKTQQLKIL